MPCGCQGCRSAAPPIESSAFSCEAEYRTVSVADDGTVSDSWSVGAERPNPWGWEVQLVPTLAADSALLGKITASSSGQGTSAIVIDAWEASRPLRIMVPWPSFSLVFEDSEAPAGANSSEVQCFALPRRAWDPILGATRLHGTSEVLTAAQGAAPVVTDAPDGATHYQVRFVDPDSIEAGNPVTIAEVAGITAAVTGATVGKYTVKAGDLVNGVQPRSEPVDLPPSPVPQIAFVNNNAALGADLDFTIHWIYALAGSA